jgi:hypothetical protein
MKGIKQISIIGCEICWINPNPLKRGYNNALQKFTLLLKEGWEVFSNITKSNLYAFHLYNTFLILLLSFHLIGCEKAVDWKLKLDNRNLLVVDGVLTNELRPQQIRLSTTIQDLNSPASPSTNAVVEVTDSVNFYLFTEDPNKPGTYFSNPFIAVVGRNYYLTIQTDTAIYHAQANAVAVTSLKELQLSDESDNLYSYLNTEDTKPSMTELYYDWSIDTVYCQTYGYCQAAETFYSLNNVDVNKAFGPEKEKIKFPKGTRVIRKKYSLTNEHQEFLRSLLIETEWRGGLFDVQQGNVETNLSNGALGYFAVCMVVSDTTMVE